MRVLAIAAHPDDETLGAGGTLLKHIERGDNVSWLIVTAPDPADWPAETVSQCRAQVETVGASYGFGEVVALDQPAARLEEVPKRELVDLIWQRLRSLRPERVYTVGDTDAHTDHRVAFEAVMLALKPFRREFDVEAIYAYEVLSSTDAALGWRAPTFVPNVYSDIGAYIERKLEIMEMFENQRQPDPLPRSGESIRALARLRGTTVGLEYAEAFHLVRQLLP